MEESHRALMLQPLVRTSATTKTASNVNNNVAVPSVDGQVYLTAFDKTVASCVPREIWWSAVHLLTPEGWYTSAAEWPWLSSASIAA